jgi:hypothetical protein
MRDWCPSRRVTSIILSGLLTGESPPLAHQNENYEANDSLLYQEAGKATIGKRGLNPGCLKTILVNFIFDDLLFF